MFPANTSLSPYTSMVLLLGFTPLVGRSTGMDRWQREIGPGLWSEGRDQLCQLDTVASQCHPLTSLRVFPLL